MFILKMIYSLQWFVVKLHEVFQAEGLVCSPFDSCVHRKWRCGPSTVLDSRTFSVCAAISCSSSGNITLLVAGLVF